MHNVTVESRTNAHWMVNVGPEIFYTKVVASTNVEQDEV